MILVTRCGCGSQDFAKKMLDFLQTEYSQENPKPLLFAVIAEEKQQPLHMCIAKEYKKGEVIFNEKETANFYYQILNLSKKHAYIKYINF